MRKRYLIAALTLVIIAALACGIYVTKHQGQDQKRAAAQKPISKIVGKEHILLGSPTLPIMGKKWYETGKENAENPSLTEVKGRAHYSFLLRGNGNEPMQPSRIFVQPQIVVSGPNDTPKEVEGFSFRYDDHIQLLVDPTSQPLDMPKALAREQAPNVDGVTKAYFRTTVRNFEAVAREAGLQKWEDGSENHYPAIIQWTETGDGDVPYLLYTLAGDCSVNNLRQIANSLILQKRAQ